MVFIRHGYILWLTSFCLQTDRHSRQSPTVPVPLPVYEYVVNPVLHALSVAVTDTPANRPLLRTTGSTLHASLGVLTVITIEANLIAFNCTSERSVTVTVCTHSITIIKEKVE